MPGGRTVPPMALHTHPRARRLAVPRAAAMSGGTSPSLTTDPAAAAGDGRILAVRGAAEPIPDGAQVAGQPGATLMPGLADTHVHLRLDAGDDPVGHLAAIDDDTLRQHLAAVARRCRRRAPTCGNRSLMACDMATTSARRPGRGPACA
jgi:imidazolonepropionase-like amidohydrolase